MQPLKNKIILLACFALLLSCFTSSVFAQKDPLKTPIDPGVADNGKMKYKDLLKKADEATVKVRVSRADLLVKLLSMDPTANDTVDFYLVGIDNTNVDVFKEFNPGVDKKDLVGKQTIILGYEIGSTSTSNNATAHPFSMSLLNWTLKYFGTYYSGLGRVCPPPICN
jgi:hypothetical protein